MVFVSSNKIAAYKSLQTIADGNLGRIKVTEYPLIIDTYN